MLYRLVFVVNIQRSSSSHALRKLEELKIDFTINFQIITPSKCIKFFWMTQPRRKKYYVCSCNESAWDNLCIFSRKYKKPTCVPLAVQARTWSIALVSLNGQEELHHPRETSHLDSWSVGSRQKHEASVHSFAGHIRPIKDTEWSGCFLSRLSPFNRACSSAVERMLSCGAALSLSLPPALSVKLADAANLMAWIWRPASNQLALNARILPAPKAVAFFRGAAVTVGRQFTSSAVSSSSSFSLPSSPLSPRHSNPPRRFDCSLSRWKNSSFRKRLTCGRSLGMWRYFYVILSR